MDQAINKCWIGKETRDDFGTFEHPGNNELMKMACSSSVSLYVRQQPKEALVTVDGKEKCMSTTNPRARERVAADILTARKPIDPPPIIQIEVRPDVDPQK